MRLIVLRHAKSSWNDATLADWHRPLSPRGVRTLPKITDQLTRWRVVPDRILSSDAVRTRLTTCAISDAFEDVEVSFKPSLYLASEAQILAMMARKFCAGQTQIWVGHNPGMHRVVEHLGGIELEKFTTGSMAMMKVNGDLELTSELRLWSPKGGEQRLG
ncbi:phosphohistidine phosphatase [Ferrimonas sediminum]|uniref:Phosphohistidine phosphatase n=1 Tax=Ferrimonas sediminum TaxID=718193 RepID=A0A1G8UA99_9GAMM|nr:histidine phosphatase family protein [Ferrimonas sediminum]SDJ50671.1 phosphohistidine phosphatase [Ferrimonas sediminum]